MQASWKREPPPASSANDSPHSLPGSGWHPCQAHGPDVLLSILSYRPNTFALTATYLFLTVLLISTLTLSHKRLESICCFFLILWPDSKNSICSSGYTVPVWYDLSSRCAGDAPRLDAIFLAHPGESFHTAEKLLHAFFRQEQLECTGASDFPCERLMIGLIWRGFMDYGALEFSENRSARWKELSRGWKAKRRNIWCSCLKMNMNNGDLPFVFAFVLFSGSENSGWR